MTQMPSRAELEFDLLDRLHKSMRVSGKSKAQIAADLGVHRNTVSNYLSGRTPVDRRTMVTWAFSTGVPLEWLETGQGDAGPSPDGTDGPEGGPDRPTQTDALARLAAKKARHAGASATHRYDEAA